MEKHTIDILFSFLGGIGGYCLCRLVEDWFTPPVKSVRAIGFTKIDLK